MRILSIAPVLLLASVSHGAIVQYVQSGFSGGQFALVAFQPTTYRITATYDTSNRQPQMTGYTTDILQGTAFIDGIGTFPITGIYRVWVSNTAQVAGFAPSLASQFPPIILGPINPGFATWDMTTSIGPFTGTATMSGPISTDHGVLDFFGVPNVPTTFQATVLPSPSAASILLFGCGLCAARRRRADVVR